MTNEIVATLKGEAPNDPWLVIHAEPHLFEQALDSITGDVLAKVHSLDAIFRASKNVVPLTHPNAGSVPAQPQTQPLPAAPPSGPPSYPPAPPVAAPEPEPQYPPAQASAPAAAPIGDIPRVNIWTRAQPGKPQYQATFFQTPFIKDKAARDAFYKGLKDGAWAKAHDTDVSPWVWIAPKGGTENFVRQYIAQHAHLFQG